MLELSHRPVALLMLEDGWALRGRSYGVQGRTIGKIVFSTGMTGRQEILIDPPYHRQAVMQTASYIGNTGVNDEDAKPDRIWVADHVVREPVRRASSWHSRRELEDDLCDAGIVGFCEVDTRILTRHLREAGAMRGGIFSEDVLPAGGTGPGGPSSACIDICLEVVRSELSMSGYALVAEVTTSSEYVVEPAGSAEGQESVAVLVATNLGTRSRTSWQFAERGVRVHVPPQSTTPPEVLALRPDGALFSNDPGDPGTADVEIEPLRDVLDARIPSFDTCLGNQLLGCALGYGTYKLTYGYRGVNQPVLDRAIGKVEVTAYNHGFAVDAPIDKSSVTPFDNGCHGRVEVSRLGLSDGVVEGLRALGLPAFSVQYHLEAAAGPHDVEHFFDRFIRLMREHRRDQDREDTN